MAVCDELSGCYGLFLSGQKPGYHLEIPAREYVEVNPEGDGMYDHEGDNPRYLPESVKSVAIKYKDGSKYIVKDDNTYNLGYLRGVIKLINNLEEANK